MVGDVVALTALTTTEPSTFLQFSMTQRGGRMLIFQGYKYVENRQSSKNTFWRCSRYVKFGCRATVVTSKNSESYPIRTSGPPHSHPKEKMKNQEILEEKEYFTFDEPL